MFPSRPAVLLDRDGVINRSILIGDVTHPPRNLAEFEFLPGVIESTKALAGAGWPLVVVTNQPDVARGIQSREAVEEINRHVVETLPVLEVFACYHDGADHCVCRKPKPGLLQEAARRWNLDLTRSIIVGDRWSDVLAGQAAGCKTVLVATPHSGADRCQPDVLVSDLAAAVAWITLSFPR